MTVAESTPLTMADNAQTAGQQIETRTGVAHRIAIVAGTGWDSMVDVLGPKRDEFPMTDLEGFTSMTVPGHAGLIRSLRIGNQEVLVFRGRRHRYEFQHDDYECMDAIVHNVRVAHAAGCQMIFLTNAVGGLNPSFQVGQPILIRGHNDQITAAPSPLRGPTFQPCTKIYNQELRKRFRQVERYMVEGLYAQVRGPHFEPEAVAEFFWNNHVEIVGMSIIQEAIMAHHLGMQVLGLSLVTDMAGDEVTHDVVQSVVRQEAPYLGQLIRVVIEQM